MESITKNRQSPEVLRAMVARAYGRSQVPTGDAFAEELGHGWFNVAYLITLADGARVVLKIAPPSTVEVMTYEREAMQIEVCALSLVAEQTAVPVPVVDFYDDTAELCDAAYFFMPFIDADNLGILEGSLPAEEVAAYARQVGAANRSLNAITGDGFGSILGPRDPQATWRSVFLEMVEDVFADGERRQVDLGWDYARLRRLFAEHADCLDEVNRPAFVEWDLWDSNVMVRDGQIVGIIDHERAFYGDPLIEAGFVAIELEGLGDATAFVRGYGQRPLTATERERRRLYNLYLLLIMVIETVFRGHTDPAQYQWARARLADQLAAFGLRPSS